MLVFSLFAQDSANLPAKSVATGSIGTVTLNGQIYNQLSIRPEIPIGKLGLGLDIYLYFNDDGMYWKSWDFSNLNSTYLTLVDKIYYLRWGYPGDDLYILAGALPSTTLGQGLLVNNYSNVMETHEQKSLELGNSIAVTPIGISQLNSGSL